MPVRAHSGAWNTRPSFEAGRAMPAAYNYTRTLVMPKMNNEDIGWVQEQLSDLSMKYATYIADDPHAPLHPPKNKGHEVMIYLTYIVDHYDELSDITIFMHAHRWSWHNNDLQNNDAAQMLRDLNPAHVQRLGYFNMRCHWNPGCPEWMHPGVTEEDINKQEETLLAKCWSELFPGEKVPEVLGQPCCGQFALSKERIRAIPLSRFVLYRDWLLRTQLSDYLSGRVWEYLWQVVFTGQDEWCPIQNVCYCEGYGMCFGGEKEYDKWFEVRYHRQQKEADLALWNEKAKLIVDAKSAGRLDEMTDLEVPELGKDEWLMKEVDDLQAVMEKMKLEALQRGKDPALRAKEAGRQWKDGDGY